MKCILIGATRGCGLETTLNLLSKGHTCYLLARSSSSFSTHLSTITIPDSQTSNLHVIEGDALNPSDIRNLFTTAGPVSFILFSLGGRVSFSPNPLKPKLTPENICSRGINVFLPIYKEFYPDVRTQPRLVVISSSGIGKQGFADLPIVMKPMYSFLLEEPHRDKMEMEKVLCKEAGIVSEDFNPVETTKDDKKSKGKKKKDESQSHEQPEQVGPSVGSQGDNKQEGITLGNLIIIRPALLTDGAQTGKVRADERLKNAYTISRKDTGWFIAEECLEENGKWRGKGVTIAY